MYMLYYIFCGCCQMAEALATKATTRASDQEYVCFVMGCDLDEHAMDLRKTAGVKAQ
jgi:hypothetical protein